MWMTSALISRWAKRFLLVSAAWFLLGQVAVLLDAPRSVVVTLGLYGFVLTTVFGKAYSLVPAYFDRQLAWARAPQVQLPLTTAGVLGLAVANWNSGPEWLVQAGTLSWALGVGIFLVTMGATVRDNLSGAETGTGDAKAERGEMDRFANAFVPLALAYLVVGTYELTATVTPLPTVLDGLGVRISHLYGPGFAVLLLFAVGHRLLPRFLSATPSRGLAAVVLPAGAVAPALLAVGYPSGTLFRAGAVLEAVAVVGFALAVALLVFRTDRNRVGFYGPLAGGLLGCLGVALGLYFAFEGLGGGLSAVHLRVNVFGLLGLSIVGVVFQFYPPAMGTWPGASDRTALVSLAGQGVGLTIVAVATATGLFGAGIGQAVATVGSALYLYLLAAAISSQT